MKKLILATALLASSTAVLAAGLPTVAKPATPGYIGWDTGIGVLGASQWNTRYNDTVRGQTGTYEMDGNPIGASIYVGNRFTPYVGAELNFNWLNDIKYKLLENTAYSYKLKNNYTAFGDGYLYYPAFENFDIFGKAGVGYVHQANEPTGYAYPYGKTDQLNTFAVNYGAGIGWHYDSLGIRVDYTQYRPTRKIDTMFNIPDVVGMSILYTWG